MKRLSFIIVGALIAVLAAAGVAAAQSIVVTIPDTSARVRDYVEIPIYVDGVTELDTIEFTLEYDGLVLEFEELIPGDRTGGFTHDATARWGQVHVVMESTNPISVFGTLATLKFEVWCDIGEPINVVLRNVAFDGQSANIEVRDGTFEARVGVSGRAGYYAGQRPISAVNVLFHDGQRTYEQTTDGDGQFEGAIPRGRYTVEATKDAGDVTPGVSAYDASLILRSLSGEMALTDDQRAAADVTGDQRINRDDAVAVLETVVGRGETTDDTGVRWVFRSDETNYDIGDNENTLDFTGVLVGDVSGNWGQGERRERDVEFALDRQTIQAGDDATLALRVDTGSESLYAAEFTMAYVREAMEITAVRPAFSVGDVLIAVDDDGLGNVRVALASDRPIRGEEELLHLDVTARDDWEGFAALHLVRATFNESIVENVGHGSITVAPHESATIGADRMNAATLVKDASHVLWDDLYVSYSDHNETGVYVGFPESFNEELAGTSVVSAVLFWRLPASIVQQEDAPDKNLTMALRRVVDPDHLGSPVMGRRSGQKTGLSYLHRDDRIGKDVPWTTQGDGSIDTALDPEDVNDPETTVLRINLKDVQDRWIAVEIGRLVQDWIDGTVPNQGLYIQGVDGWETGDRMYLDDLTLAVYYTPEPLPELDAPLDVTTEPGDGTIYMTWKTSDLAIQGVRIAKSEGMPLVSPYDPNGRFVEKARNGTFVDEDVVNGQAYYYGLVAYDDRLNPVRYGPLVVRRVVPGTLKAPEGINLSLGSIAEVNVSWSGVTGADGYVVYRRGPQERWFVLQTPEVLTDRLWSDRSVEPGQEYTYYVATVNAHGEGPPSLIQSIRVEGAQTLPAAPENLTATPVSQHAVQLNWNDRSDNELEFEVRLMDDEGWTVIGIVPANVTEYVVFDLQPKQWYEFQVRAKNTAGASDSNSVHVNTLDGPSRPKDVRWEQRSPGSVQVQWEPPRSGVARVHMFVTEASSGEVVQQIRDKDPYSGTFRVNGLEAGREYWIDVVFENPWGEARTRIESIVTTGYMIKGPGM